MTEHTKDENIGTVESTQKPRRHPDIESRLLPDGYVLLHSQKTNWVCTLTPVGGLVWEFCDGGNSSESIVRQISEIAEIAEIEKLEKLESDQSNQNRIGRTAEIFKLIAELKTLELLVVDDVEVA